MWSSDAMTTLVWSTAAARPRRLARSPRATMLSTRRATTGTVTARISCIRSASDADGDMRES